MKHNWTYKKLGEVVTIERGGSPRPIQDYITTAENGLNWIKIGDAVEGSKYITSTKEKIKPEGLKKTRFVHKGDFILSNSMSFGRPYILGIDGCIHDGWLVLHDEKEVFDKSYLYYYLSSPSIYAEFKRLAVGGVVNNLNSDIVRKVKVAIPSKDEQQAIVRVLDGINHLIELQEEQLREYDRLAQAIFYTTFGDPATNPKRWEVKKFGDILSYIKNGANIKQTKGAGGLPITRIETLSGGVFNRDRLGYADITDQLKYANFYLETGDLLMSHINSKTYIGRTVMYEKEGNETIIHGMNLLRLKVIRDMVNPVFVCYYCKTDRFKGDVAKIRKDAVNQSSICISDIVRLSLPVPPLELQQSFAAQIEAIEQQKALIRRSLDETRTLLAARMQYYFE